ncbi:MAG: Hsp70 family protein, partial [Pirellulaceae bacterium]
DARGHPTTIPNRQGDLLTPSAVLFDQADVVVGREATRGSVITPNDYAECFKRDMGSSTYHRTVRGVRIPPEVLSAFILERLKQDAEKRLGPIRQAVITVPAFFDETRRKATQDAGRLAGLDVLDIINEPTAAAVAYGFAQGLVDQAANESGSETQRVLVYDLGGGTFDVTILEIAGKQFRALATDGDVQLGGRDFDQRLVDHIADRFLEAHGVDPRSDPQDLAQLWLDAQETKHTLSERSKATVVCSYMGIRMRIEVGRKEYEELTCDLLERTEITTSLVVGQAGLGWSDIDRVLLIGGCSRMPVVASMLHRLTGKDPDCSQSPDEVVAHGAARYAGMLMNVTPDHNRSQYQLINVNSHSLGVVGIEPETGRRVNAILIPKNTHLPYHAVKHFKTAEAGQRSVQVSVVEGESHRPEECVSLGECIVRDLPPGLPKGTPVEVDYQYAANGRVSVSARVPATRQSAHVEIKRHHGTNWESLASWRSRLSGHHVRDMGARTEDNSPGSNDSNDRTHLLSQLDTMYVRMGKAALAESVPESAKGSQEAAASSLAELASARAAVRDATMPSRADAGSPQAIHEASRLSQAKTHLQQAEVRCRFACLVLGRECIDAGLQLPGLESETRDIQSLRQRLRV